MVTHDARWRDIVELLHAAEGRLPLARLASRIAANGTDTLPDGVAELHDVHLPKLARRGPVEYDDTER